ncbi:bifunctional adenosylcobinamide kinase/adenosylcobinamide-phosphate guanylyltransferase [Actinophytocola sp.]|uniref:bifunctional adenosylcobinamide kinase/adenosylcobinamide-phosphate guanylyltransferase n=1 Tax=Actinophytocola sp. TaxID=1872138 RepID=UPI002ED8B9D4
MVTLVLGGARSGKSAHAEGLLADTAATYVATARADPADAEWMARIAAHKQRRPPAWRTVELTDPGELAPFLERAVGPVIVDDLATWLTAVLDDANAWEGGSLEPVQQACTELADAVASIHATAALTGAGSGGVDPADPASRATAAGAVGAAGTAGPVGTSKAELVLVSAEVGLGVVPASRSGRLFRDQLGALNAALADRCTHVVLLVAGIPLRLR